MALKLKYAKQDEIPAGLEAHYEERDGEFHLAVEGGVKTNDDVSRLQTALTKERNDHKETKGKLAIWTKLGIEKPEELQAQLDELPTLRAAAEAGGSKSAEAVRTQVEAAKKTLETTLGRQLTETTAKLTASLAQIANYETMERHAAIRDSVVKATTDSKQGRINPDALEDVLMYAERHFETEEERDENGRLVIKGVRTRDGVGITPGLEAMAWLSEMQPRKGHWYMPSEGGGSRGNSSPNVNQGDNPWTAANWNVTAQGQFAAKHGMPKAEQMAKVAGSYIGAPNPPAARR